LPEFRLYRLKELEALTGIKVRKLKSLIREGHLKGAGLTEASVALTIAKYLAPALESLGLATKNKPKSHLGTFVTLGLR
jgi:hypothetical protein